MTLEGSPLPVHQRDLDGLTNDQWKSRATEWIYGLRARTHALDGLVTSALADVAAIRDDAARTEAQTTKIGNDMDAVKNDMHEMRGVVQFLKWAIPLSIAASGLIVALLKK